MGSKEEKLRDDIKKTEKRKSKFEFSWRSVAKGTIENYYSKIYSEALMKLLIYKDNKTVIDNDDDTHWRSELAFCITQVSKIVTKPFGRKFSAAYYNENFFFGCSGNEPIDYWINLQTWRYFDGKYYPDFLCEQTTADMIYNINLKISEYFSPLLAQRKALKANFVDRKLLDIIYGLE